MALFHVVHVTLNGASSFFAKNEENFRMCLCVWAICSPIWALTGAFMKGEPRYTYFWVWAMTMPWVVKGRLLQIQHLRRNKNSTTFMDLCQYSMTFKTCGNCFLIIRTTQSPWRMKVDLVLSSNPFIYNWPLRQDLYIFRLAAHACGTKPTWIFASSNLEETCTHLPDVFPLPLQNHFFVMLQ